MHWPKKLLLHLLYHHPTIAIPILSIEIPQNLLPYQCDNLVSTKIMDKETTDLQETSIDLIVEEELLLHLVAEYRFARYQTPRLHIGLV